MAKSPADKKAAIVILMLITFIFITISGLVYRQSFLRILPLYVSLIVALLQSEVNRYANLIGGLNSVIYSIVYLYYHLYAMAAYAFIVSFPVQIATFVLWNKQSWQNSTVLKKLSLVKRSILIVGSIAAWGIICFFLSGTGSNYKEIDTAVTVLGTVGTVLMMFSYLEYTAFTFGSVFFSIMLYAAMLKDTPEQMTYLGFSVYSMICLLVAVFKANKIYKKQQS